MKLDLIKRTAFVIMITSSIIGCKKDKMEMLVGVWDLKSLYINHIDSTDAAKSQTCYRKFSFLEEDKAKGSFPVISEPDDTSCHFHGTYQLVDDNQGLQLRFAKSHFRPIGAYLDTTQNLRWKVIFISKTDLLVSISLNGSNNEMWLKKD
jgi:hypothetical protein